MNFLSVCKNVLASNNKTGWKSPKPAIRVSKSPAGKVAAREHAVGIVDKNGEVVARLVSTTDGTPIIKCGAKVALITEFDVIPL